MNHDVIDSDCAQPARVARCSPEAADALERLAKLIDSSSFGTEVVVELSQRAPDEDVVAVCAAADEHEATGSRFPMAAAELPDVPTSTAAPASGTNDEVQIDNLVARAVTGDGRARDELLTVIHPLVLKYCRARLGRQESLMGSADDVAQDVCVAVVSALPTYQLKGLSFRAFIYGIAAHKVADAFRAIGRNRSDPVADLPDEPEAADGPERRLLAKERAALLTALVYRLTPQQRQVLVLRLGVGLSIEETAQTLRTTPGQIRVTQHRALARMRRMVLDESAAAQVNEDRIAGVNVSDDETVDDDSPARVNLLKAVSAFFRR